MQAFANLEVIGNESCVVGESPLWCESQQSWFWVDIPQKRVWKYDTSKQQSRYWNTSEMVANIAFSAQGDLIAGMETGLFRLSLNAEIHAVETRLVALPEAQPGLRFNDGRCDRQGRYWSGTMWMDMAAARNIGNLYRYTSHEGLSAPVIAGLLTQNGLAWSPDGRTMYLSDSHPQSQLVWAFDYDTDSGTPSNRRLFADMKELPGRPDGAAVDTDGCYWICANDGGAILRFTPQGIVDRQIALPMKKPAMCSFGGPNYEWMLVTSINPTPGQNDEWAGKTILLKPGAQGIAETGFQF